MRLTNNLPGGNRALEPPDPIPNSEVKQCIADGSVGFPHARVGHCQALIPEPLHYDDAEAFFMLEALLSLFSAEPRCDLILLSVDARDVMVRNCS